MSDNPYSYSGFAHILVRPSSRCLQLLLASNLVLAAVMLSYGKWSRPSPSMWLCVQWRPEKPSGWSGRVHGFAQYGCPDELSIVLLVMQLVVWQVVHVVHSGGCRNYVDSTTT